MRVLALDQATQSGWAVGNQDSFQDRTVDHGVFRMPKRMTLGERLISFDDQLVERIEYFEPDMIAYEEPYWPHPGASRGGLPLGLALSLMRQIAKDEIRIEDAIKIASAKADEDDGPKISADTLQFLQKVEAMVQMRAARAAIPVECYRSSTWRLTALGMGRAPKGSPPGTLKKMMVAKARALGYQPESEDAADAIGILMHALHGKAAAERAQGDLLAMAQERLR